MARYIDVNKAVELLKEPQEALDDYYLGLIKAERILLNMPVEDVAPVVHGKDICYGGYPYCEFMCSVCGNWIGVVEGGSLDGATGFNYCPSCGAKMDEQDVSQNS